MSEVRLIHTLKAHGPFLLLLALSVVAAGAASLLYPFGRDQGIYAYTAERLLSGYALYSEIFSFKPPLTTFVHATALALFGHSMTSIRILDLLWTIAIASALYAFVFKAFASRSMAVAAGLFYAFFYYQFSYWHTSQSDGWGILPIFVAFTLILFGYEKERSNQIQSALPFWVFGGFLFGVATLFKYTLGIFILAAMAALWLYPPGKARLKHPLLYLGSGFILPFIIVAAGLASTGSLGEFLRIQFGVVFPYVGVDAGQSSGSGLFTKLPLFFRKLTDLFLWKGLLTAILGAVFVAGAFRAGRIQSPGAHFAIRLVLLSLAGGMLSVLVQGKFFDYHYLPLLPFVAILSACILFPIVFVIHRQGPRIVVGLSLFLLLGVISFPAASTYVAKWDTAAAVARGEVDTHEFWVSDLFAHSAVSVRDNYELALYLQESLRPTAKVFIWGYEPMVYFLADRHVTSRFLYHFPLIVPWASPDFRVELIEALWQHPPEMFVVSSRDATPHVTGHSKGSLSTYAEFAELMSFVEQHYVVDRQLNRFTIFRRVSMPGEDS